MCASEDVPVPDRNATIRKIDDINKLMARQLTDQELQEKLKRQNELYAKYSGIEREQLVKRLESAHIKGDEETVKTLQEKLDNLEVPRLAWRTSLTPNKKPEQKGMSQQEKLALINLENRRRNAETVRKAQLKEMARTRELQLRYERERSKLKEGKENGDAGSAPATPAGAKTAAGSGASTPANSQATPSQKSTNNILPHIAKLQEQQRNQTKSGIPTIHRPLMDDDIIGALDLELDIEID